MPHSGIFSPGGTSESSRPPRTGQSPPPLNPFPLESKKISPYFFARKKRKIPARFSFPNGGPRSTCKPVPNNAHRKEPLHLHQRCGRNPTDKIKNLSKCGKKIDMLDIWGEGGKNGLANPGGSRHDTTSFKRYFHGHAPPPVHSSAVAGLTAKASSPSIPCRSVPSGRRTSLAETFSLLSR